MIFLVMGASIGVLVLWSIASTPRVIRRFSNPRVWLWWACWLVVGTLFTLALLSQGLEVFR